MAIGSLTDADRKGFKELDNRTTARIVTAETAGSSATSLVPVSGVSVQILPATPLRLGAILTNNAIRNAFVKYGITASQTSFTEELEPGDSLVIDQDLLYTGRIDAIWTGGGGGGGMQVTELTR